MTLLKLSLGLMATGGLLVALAQLGKVWLSVSGGDG